MSPRTRPDDEMVQAEALPQADASSLVDAEELEAEVKDMYRHVAREEEAELHFEVGRDLAVHLGYPRSSSTRSRARRWPHSRASATTSTLRRSNPARRYSISAPGPAPTFSSLRFWSASRAACRHRLHRRAARKGGAPPRPGRLPAGRVRRGAHRRASVRGRELRRRDLERRHQPLAGQGPGLRRGGARPAARAGGWRSPTSSAAAPLKERTRRDVELWAACIAGRDSRAQLHRGDRGGRPGGQGGARERLPLHLRPGSRGVQHLRGRERLAVGGEGARALADRSVARPQPMTLRHSTPSPATPRSPTRSSATGRSTWSSSSASPPTSSSSGSRLRSLASSSGSARSRA